MNTLIITTPNNPERINNVKKQFAGQSFKYDRDEFVHIDAIMLSSQPQVGIMRSFKKAILYAKLRNWKEVAIFEDDLNFLHPDSLQMFFNTWKKYGFGSYGDFLLGGIYEGDPKPMGPEITDIYQINGKFSGLHATIFPELMYDIVLSAEEPYNIDHWLSAIRKFPAFVCNPMLIMQNDGFSYNAKCETAYNKMIHKKYNLILYDNTKTT